MSVWKTFLTYICSSLDIHSLYGVHNAPVNIFQVLLFFMVGLQVHRLVVFLPYQWEVKSLDKFTINLCFYSLLNFLLGGFFFGGVGLFYVFHPLWDPWPIKLQCSYRLLYLWSPVWLQSMSSTPDLCLWPPVWLQSMSSTPDLCLWPPVWLQSMSSTPVLAFLFLQFVARLFPFQCPCQSHQVVAVFFLSEYMSYPLPSSDLYVYADL